MRLEVTPAAALAWGWLYFWDTGGLFSAALPALAAHELGHALALRMCRCPITCLHLDLTGFRLDYAGAPTRREECAALAAGPLAGTLYALAAAWAGRQMGSLFLLLSAGISLVLTAFNLLPALPLDGGRLLLCLTGRPCLARWSTLFCGLAFGGLSLLAAARGWGPVLAGPALAILWSAWAGEKPPGRRGGKEKFPFRKKILDRRRRFV